MLGSADSAPPGAKKAVDTGLLRQACGSVAGFPDRQITFNK
ncbi:hypothetical protein GLA29479_4065 [Lysobacter antibioticus]|nr:hypothetical protein GLA29479_4065 [Lysobacter antibioticus]